MILKLKLKYEEASLAPLLKYFGIPVPRLMGGSLDHSECKKPDFHVLVNILVLQRLYKDLNASNAMAVPEQGRTSLKFHIARGGNNHYGVK